MNFGRGEVAERLQCMSDLGFTEQWLTNMDDGCLTGVTFLDFRKAFDLVDHEILVQKLKCYNFDSQALEWFKSYICRIDNKVCI